ncbi:MAG: hypothetical protein VB078_09195 [Clostridiaceae bacterium]|nr:hypothetical protein [Clostridiaceae bacterium]
MWPIGTYGHFLRKIKGQESRGRKVDYFGILFCDPRQSKAREYILNYLEIFHRRSSCHIDFYIPGFIPEAEFYGDKSDGDICISGRNYLFDKDSYIDFCTKFEKDFGVEFPFSATLVLLEYKSGNFSFARKMVFELEASEEGVKSAGKLFLNIFRCAEEGKMEQTLDDLSESLSASTRGGTAIAGAKVALSFLGVNLDPLFDQYKKIQRFRVQ